MLHWEIGIIHMWMDEQGIIIIIFDRVYDVCPSESRNESESEICRTSDKHSFVTGEEALVLFFIEKKERVK